MARLPKITVQGWTTDGPAYTVHHSIAGWRNRHDRRSGAGGEELVGDHAGLSENPQTVDPAAFMVFAKGDTEVYAFKAGHVYQVTLLVDGDALDVLVDAREADRLETYGGDIQILEQRALTGDELEAALADGPAQSEGDITTLTGAQIEVSDEAVAGLSAIVEALADETPADEDEPSTGEHDYAGTVPEFVELVGAMDVGELEGYAATDSRKGVRDAAQRELDARAAQSSSEDHEAAVGGDSDSASDVME